MLDAASPADTDEDITWLRPMLGGILAADDVTTGLIRGKGLRVRGHLLIPAADAYAQLSPECARRGRTLVLRREHESDVLYCLEWVSPENNDRLWLAILLGVLTILSVLATYSLNYTMTELAWQSALAGLGQSLQFAIALVVILLAHEMGHYLVARHYGVPVTLPYLIPFPLSPFGTMGAIIRMKGIPPSRRAMLLTGAAGPLAGLAVAIPVLIVGLALSPVEPLPTSGSYVIEGNSLLYALLKYLVHGQWLPSQTHDLFMHPLAFAGWVGLLITGFNLIPAGQLDGGHVAHAWLGSKARYLTWAVIAAVLLMGLMWSGWFVWAVLILLLSRGQQEPLESITPLSPREVRLAVAMLILLALTFTPIPLRYFG